MSRFDGGYSYWHLYHFVTNKEYLPKLSRPKRSAANEPPQVKDLIPNEIFEEAFPAIIARDEISIILFADIDSSITQNYYTVLEDIEKRYSDVRVYTIDCFNDRNYKVCFDEIVNGLPLVNFYRNGEKLKSDFSGTKYVDFQYKIRELRRLNKTKAAISSP